MDQAKQSVEQKIDVTPIKYWGTLALGVLATVMLGSLVRITSQLPRTIVTDVAMAIYVLAIMAGILIIVLTLRGRQPLAAQIAFFVSAIVFGSTILLYTGRLYTASFSLLVISTIIIWQLLPKTTRRVYIGITAVMLIFLLTVEGLNPTWRITTEAGRLGPITAVIFGFILAALLVRQAWGSNIRVKIVTSFTVIALISVAIVGTVIYFSYRNQVREDIRQRLLNIISITALQQDGDLFATIQTVDDMQGSAYQKMQAVNHAILATDRDLAYIFSVRVDEQGNMVFVVDSGLEEGYVPLEVGVPYDDPSDLLAANTLTLDRAIVEQDSYTDEYGTFLSAYAPIYKRDGTRAGIVGVDIFYDKVLTAERNVLTLILVTTLGAMFVVTLIGLWLGNLFVGPVINLSAAARQIIEGNLSARAKIETTDEIGELATDFNIMTSQLQETLQGLEDRVAARTRNLELAAQVGRAVSQVRALDVMLKDACELILKEFNLYYVQVYLTDPSGSNLKLEAGTGTVGAQLIGRGHSLPLNTNSINGRAAIEQRPIVISDTSKALTFRQNPLLPETRGEMAVPLIVAGKVVGVLDMQANQPGVLTEEILPAFEALAGQLAVAVQNANLLAEAEQARAQVEAQARRLVRIGWDEHLDAIHKPEQLGYVFEQNKVFPLTGADASQPETSQAIAVPIAITGEALGELVVEINDESRREQMRELVNVVARQVSQQIENLRLLESAERYRAESEKASRLQTIEGWQAYMESKKDMAPGFLYDLKEVKPAASGAELSATEFPVTLPLKVRDEAIGKLAILGIDPADIETLDLVNEVGTRLSAHIENLRQFEETRRGQLELDRRARQLAAVAEVSTVSSRELDIQKMLESVVFLTQRRFGLYHAHVFVFDEGTQELAIAACGWKEGDEHEGTHGTSRIPVAQEQSLVARAGRTRLPVIVNDVRNEPGWLPNPLLPDTRAEVAVPLVIGEQLLGVLDVQADHLDAFTEADANIFATLASQVATALQNARSFAQAQKQAEREALLNTINQKIQSATSVEAVLQIAARELGRALNVPRTIAQISLKDQK